MNILLFGKNGQVGRRLDPLLSILGKVTSLGSDDVNFKDQDALRRCILLHKPDVIINASAYTAVDKAENEYEEVFAVNFEAVKVIAEEAIKLNAWFVHYSTDYVFDGQKDGLYTEEDVVCPLSVYGRSKASADEYIKSNSQKYIILRTSWIYDAYGKNFPKTILSLAKKNETLRVVNDQIGSPTSATLIANVTAFMLYKILSSNESNFSGVYNVSASGQASWFEFTKILIQNAVDCGATFSIQNVLPIKSSEYNPSEIRPMNSRLDLSKIQNKFGFMMPDWKVYIPTLLYELKAIGII